MTFTSISYFLFLPAVCAAYFLTTHRRRWLLLLTASCWFYMAFIPFYILILAFLIGVDYAAGIAIESSLGWKRKALLTSCLVVNFSVLVLFKYFNFFSSNVSAALSYIGASFTFPTLSLVLPLGLSFHVFQSVSYTIEVYYRRQQAERRLGIYALYVMFFPQLVAGPIERPKHLLPQFDVPHVFRYDNAVAGLKLIAWGFFQKIVIADRLSLFVDQAYTSPATFGGTALVIATIFFSFQIYSDFSAYTNIAIGSAKIMGFELVQNFNRPYLASSVAEFWSKWHMSLSQWFRDYCFSPLALATIRYGTVSVAFSVLTVMFLSGLWHGAAWTFCMWGLLHGFFLIAGRLRHGVRLPRWIEVLTTFALVSFSWIFFRAASLGDATYIIRAAASALIHWRPGNVQRAIESFPYPAREFYFSCALIVFLIGKELMDERGGIDAWLASKPAILRWSFYYAFLVAIVIFGRFHTKSFLYFQF